MIPGNEKRVIRLMNQIANCGTSIKLGSVEGLHTSGHAFAGELQEVRNLLHQTMELDRSVASVCPCQWMPVDGMV